MPSCKQRRAAVKSEQNRIELVTRPASFKVLESFIQTGDVVNPGTSRDFPGSPVEGWAQLEFDVDPSKDLQDCDSNAAKRAQKVGENYVSQAVLNPLLCSYMTVTK